MRWFESSLVAQFHEWLTPEPPHARDWVEVQSKVSTVHVSRAQTL